MKTKKTFQELVKDIEVLQDSEQGKLKGGFTSISGISSIDDVLMNNCKNSCPKGCVSAEEIE